MEIPEGGNEGLLAREDLPVPITHSGHKVDIGEAFDMFLEATLNLPKGLSGVALDMASMEIFERAFRIYAHQASTDPNNPIPLVTRNPKLDFHRLNPMRTEMESLLKLQAPRRSNMSIIDILDLDTFTYDALLGALRSTSKDESVIAGDLMDEMDDMTLHGKNITRKQ